MGVGASQGEYRQWTEIQRAEEKNERAGGFPWLENYPSEEMLERVE